MKVYDHWLTKAEAKAMRRYLIVMDADPPTKIVYIAKIDTNNPGSRSPRT